MTCQSDMAQACLQCSVHHLQWAEFCGAACGVWAVEGGMDALSLHHTTSLH